ncbi:SDR family oxidoreductase [Marinobacterium sediminicola]|uniref:NADP-dependent 3-hydroxy acid dehydrogenase YdfG n=1 Tax=Marinobacterium sediminicola TaxID=518898 RepID=A0ABY1RXJ7_9GAMM|nr:SDR family oxidoreductase [Marinobacterium sediminicola]ULG67720.1 SDR family oxidoreductase [Marinobacterium sediminicola]SMR71638.1 NADP-dependent 3-hydroxy acid dehydrogenase YdfG [Marinobacterium sediminicola]
MKFKGKRAWVTGASSGIGQATAKALAAEGAELVLSARRADRLEALAHELRHSGALVHLEPLDVSDRQAIEAAGERMAALGGIDILINNAGTMPISPIINGRVDEWEQMIDVNIKGVLYAIHAVYSGMAERKQGHIINVSSIAARTTYPSAGVYAGTKHAVRAISETLRKEAIRFGVRVTDIQPGSVDTELPDSIGHDKIRGIVKSNMYGDAASMLKPEDIANAIIYALEQPQHVDVGELLIWPTRQEN